jgi:predicted regulator of Ras-like GTPase activity (Roadblock/LC7/MglB family)
MNQEGAFPISVLTDKEGFPIASATSNGQDPEKQAAVVAMVQRVANQVHSQLGMGQSNEISLYDSLGQRLVCRIFTAGRHDMILAVQVPHREQTYRRLTNLAIQAIRKNWE